MGPFVFGIRRRGTKRAYSRYSVPYIVSHFIQTMNASSSLAMTNLFVFGTSIASVPPFDLRATRILWNGSNGRHIRTLKGHTDEVYSVAFSPDNTQLASASRDRSIPIWDVKDLNPPAESRDGLFTIAISSNMRFIAAVRGSRDIHLFDSKSSEPRTKLPH